MIQAACTKMLENTHSDILQFEFCFPNLVMLTHEAELLIVNPWSRTKRKEFKKQNGKNVGQSKQTGFVP